MDGTKEQSAYSKWVNFTVSLLLPGLGHFLSGRRKAGIIWFLINLALTATAISLSVLPFTKSVEPLLYAWLFKCLLWLSAAVESCNAPIPRLNFRGWGTVCLAIIAIAALQGISQMASFKVFSMPSDSMAPTLMGNRKSPDGKIIEGDQITVNRWSYRGRLPKRGDVVVFRTDAISPEKRDGFRIPTNEIFVKRVMGLPGERVAIRPPWIYVNGEKVVEPKVLENLFNLTGTYNGRPVVESMRQTSEVQLGPDEYFVLGDNIGNSFDSCSFGPIKSGRFIGRVVGIFWPPERRGFVQ